MPCFTKANPFSNVSHDISKAEKQSYEYRVKHRPVPESKRELAKRCKQVQGYDALQFKKPTPRSKKVLATNKTIISQKDMNRLREEAKVSSVDKRLQLLMQKEEEADRLEREADRLRQRFKEIDDKRKQEIEAGIQKDDVFGNAEKVKVLERAFLAKHEQEEEVQVVNRIILDAKCHAVRDAQIQEKVELENLLRADEKRLNKIVIDRALEVQCKEDKKHEEHIAGKLNYAREIKRQLKERENLRFLEAERQEAEGRMFRKAMEAIKAEDARKVQLQKERRKQFTAELGKVCEMSNLFKKMLNEQEKEAEARVAAYLREKEKRDLARKAELDLQQAELQRKQRQSYTASQKIIESKTHRDEMTYLREREAIEREYRRKEKEAAERRKKVEESLAISREDQVREIKHRYALQLARDENDFQNLRNEIKKNEQKEQKRDDERSRRNGCYRDDIVRQINQNEMHRRRQLDEEKNDVFAFRETQRQRDSNIRAVIKAKLEAMRDACLPEKYIKDVEKKMQNSPALKVALL